MPAVPGDVLFRVFEGFVAAGAAPGRASSHKALPDVAFKASKTEARAIRQLRLPIGLVAARRRAVQKLVSAGVFGTAVFP